MAERKEAERGFEEERGLDQRFRAPLCAYFTRRVQDRATADELAQEVFVRLTRNPGLTAGDTPENHVFKVASGVLQDWGRYHAARKASTSLALGEVSETLGTPSCVLEGRSHNVNFGAAESLRGLEEALCGLGWRTREIFLLSRIENVPHREIAKLHGIAESAVEQHVLAAIAHLSVQAFTS